MCNLGCYSKRIYVRDLKRYSWIKHKFNRLCYSTVKFRVHCFVLNILTFPKLWKKQTKTNTTPADNLQGWLLSDSVRLVKTHQNILVTIIRQTQAASAHIGSAKTWERLSFLHFFWLIGSVDYQNRCWLTFLAIERSINRLVVSALSTQQVTGE